MFKEVNLEISMKVFKKNDTEYIKGVVSKIFDQWRAVLLGRERISILFWLSDGSDLLDYGGELYKTIEWAYFAGCANKPQVAEGEDLDVNLHTKCVKYMDDVPTVTYRTVKDIVTEIKAEGKRRYPGSVISMGIPFDIGPEFAISEFKYKRHPEICTGNGEGGKTFINSYGTLSADDYHYAAYPDGIPEGTPFGEFLGKQAKEYMRDLGFDYLWLSNGVGFSPSSWDPTGEVFDGKSFKTEKFEECRDKVFSFWENFRRVCPDIPIHTRGTNFSAGIDYASDAVPLLKIYRSNLGITPPPNSPWASINGNYGLEIMGHMTRNCELPLRDMMFRFYLHDCWWVNSPWYDRYEQSPHDIYLPMSVGRIDAQGQVSGAGILDIFTLDNTFGDMPDHCANEVIPHILRAEKDTPDAPAPFVWLYPLKEYSSAKDEAALKRIISGDLFITRAITGGLPLNTVISSENFLHCDRSVFSESILITPVPDSGSELERALTEYASSGGKIIFLGSIDGAGERFLSLFSITPKEVTEDLEISVESAPDTYRSGAEPRAICLRLDHIGKSISSDGKIYKKYKNSIWYQAPIELDSLNYDTYSRKGLDAPDAYVYGSEYLRKILTELGYVISFDKPDPKTPATMLTVSRSDNAFCFTAYNKSQTVSAALRFPDGAPILNGYEVEIKNGCAIYSFPRCEHKECRVFVGMDRGRVFSRELPPVSKKYRRKLMIGGLENAAVRIYPEEYCKGGFTYKILGDENEYDNDSMLGGTRIFCENGKSYAEIENVSGVLIIAFPYK